MEFDKIMQLIEAVSKSNLTQFSMEEGNLKLSMKTNKQTKMVAAPVFEPGMEQCYASPQEEANALGTDSVSTFYSAGEGANIVKSPLVGTFYNAASPEAESYVKVGDTVKKGQVLGIVEAMKLMNEIESEFDGTVEEILVNNEDVVEYGQPLFVIR